MWKLVLFIMLLVFISPIYSMAAESGEETASGNATQVEDNYLGLGALIRTRPYKDVDTSVLPVPIIYWREGKFYSDGRKLGFDLYDSKNGVTLDLLLKLRLMGYDNEDSDFLNGMEDREWSLDGGGRLRWAIPDSDDVAINLTGLTDFLSKHEGQEVSLSIEKKIQGRYFRLTPSVGLSWQSEDLVNYYYGVKSNEARSNRPAYKPDSTVNYYLDVNFNLGLSEDLVLVTLFNFEMLGSEIHDSPIVEDDYVLSGGLGIVKKF